MGDLRDEIAPILRRVGAGLGSPAQKPEAIELDNRRSPSSDSSPGLEKLFVFGGRTGDYLDGGVPSFATQLQESDNVAATQQTD